MAAAILCGKCQTPVDPGIYNLGHPAPCRSCEASLEVYAFATMFHSVAPAGPVAAGDSDAACFYHHENVAVATCASCGRFLCGVCEMDFGGEVLCPTCVHAGVTTRKMARLENRRTMYDTIALVVASAPALMMWPTIFTAPMAIFLSIRYWKQPLSIVRRSRIRFVIAILLGAGQIAFWGFAAYFLAITYGVMK